MGVVMRDGASDGATREGAVELDASWLPIAHPPRPRTCVACGGISLRGFVYCGWCGKVLRDDTQIGVPQPVADVAPAVRSAALGYAADPVDFPASQQITIQHWPADASPAQEITQPSAPIRVDAPPPSDDTDPRVQLLDVKLTGMCVVVLGTGPTGMHHSATDVHALSVGDELDVMLGDGRAPTSFRVENDGLRVEEIGTTRGVARCIKSGRVGLRNGDAFRIGQTWLVYARHEGREQWGIWGRIYVLAPSGHVVTS